MGRNCPGMFLSPFGNLSHTPILYYCIQPMHFLEYNDFMIFDLNTKSLSSISIDPYSPVVSRPLTLYFVKLIRVNLNPY
jgi:hypothetical protein